MQNKFFANKIMLAMIAFFGISAAHASINQPSTDGVVAVVNDEIILKSELNQAHDIIKKQLLAANIQATEEQISERALDELITHKLQLSLVNRAGMVTNEEVINQQLLQIALSEGYGNLADFQAALDAQKMGSYAALRKQVIENAALTAMWQNQIGSRVYISEAEVNTFLNSPEGLELSNSQPVILTEWQTSHILARVDEKQSNEIAEQKINALYEQIQQGADFQSLAATYSDDAGSASNYGNLGWVSEGQMVPEFENMMKQTAAGDYSTPFRSQFGWHILKVNEIRQHDVTEQARKNIAREILFSRQAPQAQEDWLQELRSSAYIQIFK